MSKEQVRSWFEALLRAALDSDGSIDEDLRPVEIDGETQWRCTFGHGHVWWDVMTVTADDGGIDLMTKEEIVR